MNRIQTTNIGRMGAKPVKTHRLSPKHMAVPKPECRGHMPDVSCDLMNIGLGTLAPDERQALDQIVETADLVEVEGCSPYLLIPTTPALLDVLAALGSEAMDREPDVDHERGGDHEPNTGDDEPQTGDDEPENECGPSWPETHGLGYMSVTHAPLKRLNG